MAQQKQSLAVQTRPDPYDLLVKVVTIGDSGSGKTSLIHRFVNGAPLEDSAITLGVEFSSKHFVKEDGKVIRAQFWDTAGNDRYHALTSSYFRGAVAAAVVYDISNFQSFKNVSFWLKEIKAKCNENIVIILIGNKSDLDGERQIDRSKAAAYAEKHSIAFMETSARDGTDVNTSFEMVVNEVYRVLKANGEIEQSMNTSKPTGTYQIAGLGGNMPAQPT